MKSEWNRLRSDFKELMDRSVANPPFVNITGTRYRDSPVGWIRFQVCGYQEDWAAESLRKKCERAGQLIPISWHPESIQGLAVPRPSKPIENHLDRWLLFVASVTRPYDSRIPGFGGPGLELDVVSDGERISFSGKLWSLPAACELAVDNAITMFGEQQEIPTSDTNPTDGSAPLDGNEVAVLMLLKNRKPVLCTLDDVTNMSRNTAGKALRKLIDAGYAHRPKGNRKGATITDSGLSVVQSLSQVAH